MKILLSADDIQRRVAEMARQIAADYQRSSRHHRRRADRLFDVPCRSRASSRSAVTHRPLAGVELSRRHDHARHCASSPNCCPTCAAGMSCCSTTFSTPDRRLRICASICKSWASLRLRIGVLLRKEGRQQVPLERGLSRLRHPRRLRGRLRTRLQRRIPPSALYRRADQMRPFVTANTRSLRSDPPCHARTILFVIPSLEYSGAARQLCLLAAGLPRESFRVRVAVLGQETPWWRRFGGEGIEVEVLEWRRPFDVLPFVVIAAVGAVDAAGRGSRLGSGGVACRRVNRKRAGEPSSGQRRSVVRSTDRPARSLAAAACGRRDCFRGRGGGALSPTRRCRRTSHQCGSGHDDRDGRMSNRRSCPA